jgi:hypothetical protein
MEKSFTKLTLALLFLSVFTLAAITSPVAKAQGMSLTLTPSEGPPGTQVIVAVANFPPTETAVSVTLGGTNVGSIYVTGYSSSSASEIFYVPTVPVGKYTVTATGSEGEVATATFTVTPIGTSTGTPSGIPSGIGPTYSPVKAAAGFWSPLAVGIVAFVVAIACFMTAVFVRRGRQGPVRLEDDSSYKLRSPVGSTQPTNYKSTAQETSPYGYRPSDQPASPYSYRSRSSAQETSPYSSRYAAPPTRYTATPQYNQTATSPLQPPAHTKICKHCKRDVRDDLNVCPYCFKKLK